MIDKRIAYYTRKVAQASYRIWDTPRHHKHRHSRLTAYKAELHRRINLL